MKKLLTIAILFLFSTTFIGVNAMEPQPSNEPAASVELTPLHSKEEEDTYTPPENELCTPSKSVSSLDSGSISHEALVHDLCSRQPAVSVEKKQASNTPLEAIENLFQAPEARELSDEEYLKLIQAGIEANNEYVLVIDARYKQNLQYLYQLIDSQLPPKTPHTDKAYIRSALQSLLIQFYIGQAKESWSTENAYNNRALARLFLENCFAESYLKPLGLGEEQTSELFGPLCSTIRKLAGQIRSRIEKQAQDNQTLLFKQIWKSLDKKSTSKKKLGSIQKILKKACDLQKNPSTMQKTYATLMNELPEIVADADAAEYDHQGLGRALPDLPPAMLANPRIARPIAALQNGQPVRVTMQQQARVLAPSARQSTAPQHHFASAPRAIARPMAIAGMPSQIQARY